MESLADQIDAIEDQFEDEPWNDDEWKAMEERERQERVNHEALMWKEGLRWYVDACIHPEHGGDDQMVTLYFSKKPTNNQIIAELKKQGSCYFADQFTQPKQLKDPKGGNTMKKDQAHTKETLNGFKMVKLVEIYNAMNPPKQVGPKAFSNKTKAIERILALQAKNEEAGVEEVVEDKPEETTPPAEEASSDLDITKLDEKFKTIRECSEFLIRQADDEGLGLPYKNILNIVLANFPKAKTSLACLRWYAGKMREAGETLPKRRPAAKK